MTQPESELPATDSPTKEAMEHEVNQDLAGESMQVLEAQDEES